MPRPSYPARRIALAGNLLLLLAGCVACVDADAWAETPPPIHQSGVRGGLAVWVGGAAIICPGVRIGSRSIIGAGSVVTRDIPEDTFAAGNPCRVIRKLAP